MEKRIRRFVGVVERLAVGAALQAKLERFLLFPTVDL